MVLDEKGRCCGRKPVVYKSTRTCSEPHRFCTRCCRAYYLTVDEQKENWAWTLLIDGGWRDNRCKR